MDRDDLESANVCNFYRALRGRTNVEFETPINKGIRPDDDLVIFLVVLIILNAFKGFRAILIAFC